MAKLTKIQVSKGLFWVEAPEAELCIMCSCPADSVKHLMKRGLIVTKEENGITFETGPNVILLSDVLIQNGSFSNMAEYPTLQMLYRQGMILPNHPCNTGVKPILVGSESQIAAQMQYIFRGNYGLATEKELVTAGADPQMAAELIRLKLKFSFGKILQTEELLDYRIVGNGSVEIKNGVYVRRLRLNVFEFSYQDERVIVDLNLQAHDRYPSPYTLGFQNIEREYFGIIHSGNGDGWDTDQPEMSSVLMFQGKIYLIDAGPNILHSLTALGIGVNEVEGIFHTHSHDDHFAGLADLMRSDQRMKYYATPLVRTSVIKKMAALMSRDEDDFINYFEVHDLQPDTWNDIDSLEVRPVFSPHPVETTVLLFRTLGGDGYRRTYAHLADIISLEVLKDMVTDNPDSPGVSQHLYEQVKEEYLKEVDLKKIDIGKGMIHGNADDFKSDHSSKIVLSHTSRDLTAREKQIGSGAPFGMVDVLIPSHQDYMRMYAHNYLRTYFPDVPTSQLRILLNNPLETFNPESILLRCDMVNDVIYLILTGEVEMINSVSGVHNILSAGGLVGEISGLTRSESLETYRATNFVNVLQIPSTLYLKFVITNGLYAETQRLQEKRQFLQKTWLFGESISYPIQNNIAQAMHVRSYQEDKQFFREVNRETITMAAMGVPDNLKDEPDCPVGFKRKLYVVKKGIVQIYVGNDVIETLHAGDFFGEGTVLFNTPSLYKVRLLSSADIFHIKGEVLLDIPIVGWKLFETYVRRMEMMIHPETLSVPFFEWREEYNVNIKEMDEHHRKFFSMANLLHGAILDDKKTTIHQDLMDFLVDYSAMHFDMEEGLMKKYGYPEFDLHKIKHQRFADEAREIEKKLRNGEMEIDMRIVNFLTDWIINHILIEDRKYTQYLNEKGVF
ncbi:MAG: bacteriohemerythrin [Desulfobulbaceae bacterium]|nr:bacteriohemerythrin [Desulfobulbaceae bacterium]